MDDNRNMVESGDSSPNCFCWFLSTVWDLIVKFVTAVLLVLLVIPVGIIFISSWVLSKLFQRAFKTILSLIDEESFKFSILVLTSLVGYYQIPKIPFLVYISFFFFLVILKWLRGSECGILKDKVCLVIYNLGQEWVFRNFSVLGIKLHGCHPVTKCVFKSADFLFHEKTEINPKILFSVDGFWDPPALELIGTESWNILMSGSACIDIKFPVNKGPLDQGHQHFYEVSLRYESGLLRYRVCYYEDDDDRGCTDDFLIEMDENEVKRFYKYIISLKSETALISVLDHMCHCEKMFAVANLIKKGEKIYKGSFDKKSGSDKKERVFCGIDGVKALLKSKSYIT